MQPIKTASFEFKCRRCGLIDQNPHTSEAIAIPCLIEAILEVRKKTFGVQAPSLLSMHVCRDGGHGVMDLIGFAVKKEGEGRKRHKH